MERPIDLEALPLSFFVEKGNVDPDQEELFFTRFCLPPCLFTQELLPLYLPPSPEPK